MELPCIQRLLADSEDHQDFWMWESIRSFFWKHPGVSRPKWAPEHHRVSCTEGESSGKHSFPWINPSSHGLTMAVTPSCLKKEPGNSMERGVRSSSPLPGAVGPRSEQGKVRKGLWDSPGIAATPHGMLCNPSNAVVSPVADKTF